MHEFTRDLWAIAKTKGCTAEDFDRYLTSSLTKKAEELQDKCAENREKYKEKTLQLVCREAREILGLEAKESSCWQCLNPTQKGIHTCGNPTIRHIAETTQVKVEKEKSNKLPLAGIGRRNGCTCTAGLACSHCPKEKIVEKEWCADIYLYETATEKYFVYRDGASVREDDNFCRKCGAPRPAPAKKKTLAEVLKIEMDFTHANYNDPRSEFTMGQLAKAALSWMREMVKEMDTFGTDKFLIDRDELLRKLAQEAGE